MTPSEIPLPARALFRFAVPCYLCEPIWGPQGSGLTERHLLPHLAELDGQRAFAQMRLGWSPAGLAFHLRVEGKRQPPWCRDARPEDSDGLRLWIDTRDVHNVHRASRFCQQFVFLPAGAGRRLDEACGGTLPIHRAREAARPVDPSLLQARREQRVDGYILEGFIPAAALHGFDPEEHPRLGFTYAVVDRELGEQNFSSSATLPFREDPSLWATLLLKKR